MNLQNAEFGDELDKDGEMEIIVECPVCDYADTIWLSESDAEALIAHLTSVFKLGDE